MENKNIERGSITSNTSESVPETEPTPDSLLGSILAEAEAESDADGFEAKDALEKFKESTKENPTAGAKAKDISLGVAKFGLSAGRMGMFLSLKMAWSLLKLSGLFLLKKGKIGWKEAYKIGQDALDFEVKKDKK